MVFHVEIFYSLDSSALQVHLRRKLVDSHKTVQVAIGKEVLPRLEVLAKRFVAPSVDLFLNLSKSEDHDALCSLYALKAFAEDSPVLFRNARLFLASHPGHDITNILMVAQKHIEVEATADYS